jgi:nucleoside 2-deoxyribosyltransferase
VSILTSRSELDKVKLTSWLVEQRRLGVDCPELTSNSFKQIGHNRPPSVYERADALLRYLAAKSDLLGMVIAFRIPIEPKSAATVHEVLAWTASRQGSEIVTLAEYCHTQGWIERRAPRNQTLAETGQLHEWMLAPPGYARLAELDVTGTGSEQAFVAMWFDESMSDAYESGIEPAIQDAGYKPLRIDRKDHNNKIDDEIIAEIRRSRFVVADFTQGTGGARGGVYYEAGFAHGYRIPVIFTCKEDAIGRVHFDTRQYNHIAWKDTSDLRTRLAQRISATIGDGPKKKI